MPTRVQDGPAAVVAGIVDLAAELATEPGIRAIGLGVPGIVDGPAGVARWAANLGWRDVPFAPLIGERTGLDVALGHDVRNGALAEARWGAGRASRSVYFLAIGTGIAGGAVLDGVVDDGAGGQAGEIGHLVVVPGGPACNCGNHGCLETLASASRIAAAYSRAVGGEFSAADVARRAADGEPAAVEVWARAVGRPGRRACGADRTDRSWADRARWRAVAGRSAVTGSGTGGAVRAAHLPHRTGDGADRARRPGRPARRRRCGRGIDWRV